MIEQIAIKELLGFKVVDIAPSDGLNIFSGASGAGKSVLISAMLALFGYKDSQASYAETVIKGVEASRDMPIDIDDGEAVIKQIKKDKIRFFINDSQVSKGALKNIFSNKVRYLNHKDTNDISSATLLELLDLIISKSTPNYAPFLAQYKLAFGLYEERKLELLDLIEKEKKSVETKELLQFEIEKIEAVNPAVGEFERLMEYKKRLSKKEKIAELIAKVSSFKDDDRYVYELYELLEQDSALFGEAMNELNGLLENAISDIEEMENSSLEQILDRIEAISKLVRRYGSVEECLAQLKSKKVELESFESIEFEIKKLQKIVDEARASLEEDAKKIANYRVKATATLESSLNIFLKQLYLRDAKVLLAKGELDLDAGMKCAVEIGGVGISKISSGEFNRLRLALLASRVELGGDEQLVLFLDEIDANVSGEEAASIAKVLVLLAKRYQIFAISHQAQLSSKADKHFLVSKNGDESMVAELDYNGRVDEIARIISGEEITATALEHAKELLK